MALGTGALLALGCSRPFVHTMVADASVRGNSAHFVVRTDRELIAGSSVVFVEVSSGADEIVLLADDPEAGGTAADRRGDGSAAAHFDLRDGLTQACDAADHCELGLTAVAESADGTPVGVSISLVASFGEGTPPSTTRLELVLDGRAPENTRTVSP